MKNTRMNNRLPKVIRDKEKEQKEKKKRKKERKL